MTSQSSSPPTTPRGAVTCATSPSSAPYATTIRPTGQLVSASRAPRRKTRPYSAAVSVIQPRGSTLHPDRHAARGEVPLRFAHPVLAVVEDRGDERGAGAAGDEPLVEVLERARAARRDDRDADPLDDGPGELEVVARARPVAVHARQQDLAGT